MADELTINASMKYADSEGADVAMSIVELVATVATKKFTKYKQAVGFAAEEAVGLGDISAPGWALFCNRDATNFISLKVATSGAVFAKLLPGEFALLRLGSGAQAPFAIADTASCQLEVFIAST